MDRSGKLQRTVGASSPRSVNDVVDDFPTSSGRSSLAIKRTPTTTSSRTLSSIRALPSRASRLRTIEGTVRSLQFTAAVLSISNRPTNRLNAPTQLPNTHSGNHGPRTVDVGSRLDFGSCFSQQPRPGRGHTGRARICPKNLRKKPFRKRALPEGEIKFFDSLNMYEDGFSMVDQSPFPIH